MEVPKSAKKKGVDGDSDKGALTKPLFIADWSNAQIVKYCDACGIFFSDSVNDCINHVRNLEKLHASGPLGIVPSSSEGRGW